MRRAAWALIMVVPLVVVLALGFGRDPSVVASPLLNKPAPAFTLRTLTGRPLSLADLHGKPVVLNFWASWCTSCMQEHPTLLAAWRTYGRRVAFVGVGFRDTRADLRGFMRQYGGSWSILQDPGAQTAINYGVAGPPETFFIDRYGIVRYKAIGPVDSALLAREIPRLLGAGA